MKFFNNIIRFHSFNQLANSFGVAVATTNKGHVFNDIVVVNINDDLSVLLNDTVGFINKLPCSLVASFKSTLDEILGADLILHVIDISSEFAQEHINSVEQILREIGADHIPVIKVYNKADLLDNMIESGTHILPDDILISTYTKQGIDTLKERISEFFLSNNECF